jgi:DNA polymerase-1
MFVIDIETRAIVKGAPTLPEPVGIALRSPNGESVYYAFGHPDGNNSDWDEAKRVVSGLWGQPLLTHNGCAFDLPVLQKWFNLPPRHPLLNHDTMLLAYLNDPREPSLSLKDLTDLPATAQSELHDWIMRNTACRSRKKAGAHIWQAPGDLVGTYACADVEMTWQLYRKLQGVRFKMPEAYDRERRLAPILANLQHRGVRVDVERLTTDINHYRTVKAAVEQDLLDELGDFNLDSNEELVYALQAAGYTDFLLTETGKPSVSKASLQLALAGRLDLLQRLTRRSQLCTVLGTFMEPWLEIAEANGGRLHPSYNQTRNPEGFGTRTGRLSSSHPNLQNVPGHLADGLPVMRSYLLPEEGHVWITGDFKAQEPRIAAHFEDGKLLKEFQDSPELDPYEYVMGHVANLGRKPAKTIFLGLLYGMGLASLAESLKVTEYKASELREAVRFAIPGIVAMDKDIRQRLRQPDGHITTMGGRRYTLERSKDRDLAYKGTNALIQGSAADQTKEALIYVQALLLPDERILSTVHDEISVSAPVERVNDIAQMLQEAANALPCDCPMVMSVKHGNTFAEASK